MILENEYVVPLCLAAHLTLLATGTDFKWVERVVQAIGGHDEPKASGRVLWIGESVQRPLRLGIQWVGADRQLVPRAG